MNQNILGYQPGEIAAGGCTTIDIVVAGLGVSLKEFIDCQYLDSKIMSRRPGMVLKFLPYLYDGVTGKLLTGGSYLFDTYENAKDYIRWASEEFEVGKPPVKFTEQPMFESVKSQVWKVIGAHGFAPIEANAVVRLQMWRCADVDTESKLRAIWENLKRTAENDGAASVWLLFNPDTRDVGLQLTFKKLGGHEPADATHTLHSVGQETRVAALIASNLVLEPTFDRTSMLLTLWLPQSRELGGSELAIPYYPLVPAITHDLV